MLGWPDRFWSKVRKTRGCWYWIGGKRAGSYGATFFEGRRCLAHRAAWIIAHGEITNGKQVLHRCDEPSCVRPSHLFLGDHTTNMEDMRHKGRRLGRGGRSGEANSQAKLSERDVRTIRNLAGKEILPVTAKRYGVSVALISLIRSRKVWRHVT